MSRHSFHSKNPNLLKLCKTEKNIEFLETLYLVFHQIFLYRLTGIELDISRYEHLKSEKIDSFEKSYQMTVYTIYQNIINSILSDGILEKNFHLFNSYEKISFASFVQIAKEKISEFDVLEFWKFLDNQEPSEKQCLDMRLIEDFTLSQEWYEYMETQKNNS
ncbi:MAG: hypothetical protein PHY14_00380 [Candidatus Gracilibacteria bacterium]|nr:hypothetical protein [Candidatus Gracilibacteria bacterium]